MCPFHVVRVDGESKKNFSVSSKYEFEDLIPDKSISQKVPYFNYTLLVFNERNAQKAQDKELQD
jgi:hypothetical protein